MKINIKIVGVVLAAVILLLIFFSKTIYSYNLPTVTAVLPTNDKLNKLETVSGIVDWADMEEIYAEVAGKLVEILVSEGDKVVRGQPLFRFDFNRDDAERALQELDVSRKKLALDIETIHKRMDKTARTITDLESETYEKDNMSDYELTKLENQRRKLDEEYERAKSLQSEEYEKNKGLKTEEYENAKALFEVGAVSVQELEALERELEKLDNDYDNSRTERDYNYTNNRKDLDAQYENLLETMAEQEKKENESIEDKEKARQKSLSDYRYDIETMQQDLKAKNLELSNLDIQEQKYKKALADFNNSVVVNATADATVISIPVKKGQYVNANAQLASLGVGNVFTVNCTVSLDNNFVTTGDSCTLSNSSHALDGTVTKLTPTEGGKQIMVSIESEDVSAGETFDIQFEKESADSYILVPNGAVNRDSDGYFLYQVKRRDGILGKEYYAEKLRVYISDSDNDNTVIIKGVTFFEPVVLLSDKPFSENETLLLGNEGDFFAGE